MLEMLLPNSGASYNAPLGVRLCNHSSSNILCLVVRRNLDAALACYKLLVNRVIVFSMSS